MTSSYLQYMLLFLIMLIWLGRTGAPGFRDCDRPQLSGRRETSKSRVCRREQQRKEM